MRPLNIKRARVTVIDSNNNKWMIANEQDYKNIPKTGANSKEWNEDHHFKSNDFFCFNNYFVFCLWRKTQKVFPMI